MVQPFKLDEKDLMVQKDFQTVIEMNYLPAVPAQNGRR
jgi:hypothetical protein